MQKDHACTHESILGYVWTLLVKLPCWVGNRIRGEAEDEWKYW
jgi:hypothetical protein